MSPSFAAVPSVLLASSRQNTPPPVPLRDEVHPSRSCEEGNEEDNLKIKEVENEENRVLLSSGKKISLSKEAKMATVLLGKVNSKLRVDNDEQERSRPSKKVCLDVVNFDFTMEQNDVIPREDEDRFYFGMIQPTTTFDFSLEQKDLAPKEDDIQFYFGMVESL